MSRSTGRQHSAPARQFRMRRRLLVAGLTASAVLIVGRAVQLQAIEGERWLARAEQQQKVRIPLPPRRGAVLDRNHVPLGLTHEAYRVAVAPAEIRDPEALQVALREVLHLSPTAAASAVDPADSWVVLPVRASALQREALGEHRGVHFERYLQRFYPARDAAREVLGTLGADGLPLGGIEQELDPWMRGSPGYAVARRNAAGKALPSLVLPVVPPSDGADVVLTLDLDLQEIASGALTDAIARTNADGGDLIMVDPQTGEILAAVSRRRGSRTRLLTGATEPFEPGSTLKPIFVASLLASQRAALDDSVFAEEGRWTSPQGRVLADVGAHTWLSLRDALRVSSNIAMAKFATRLSPREQYTVLRAFGFGSPTGVQYPAEASGRLRPPASWSKYSQASLAIGYELAVTPLQMAMAYSALANGGVLLEPRLVKEIRTPPGRLLFRSEPRIVRRVVPTGVAAAVTDALVEVVDSGTAAEAAIGHFAIAGKTGTARRTGRDGRYEYGSYTATFAGYFPAEDPAITIFVKLDRPQGQFYGGLTAAPVSRETLQALLAAWNRRVELGVLGSQVAANRAPASARGRALRTSHAGGVDTVELRSPPGRIERARPLPTPVPDVRGDTFRDAVRRLHSAGFRVRLQGVRQILDTAPPVGTPVLPGDTVLLIGENSP